MNSNLNRLFLLIVFSASMTACSTNPVVDNNPYPTSNYNVSNNTTNTTTSANNTTQSSTTEQPSNTEKYTYTGSQNSSSSNSNSSNTVTTYPATSYESPATSYESTITYGSTDSKETTSPPMKATQKGFVVQLTASISKEKTDRIKNTFSSEGYPVIQNSVSRNGQVLYRVQIGPYRSKREAQRIFKQLKKRYRHNPYVKSSFVNENK